MKMLVRFFLSLGDIPGKSQFLKVDKPRKVGSFSDNAVYTISNFSNGSKRNIFAKGLAYVTKLGVRPGRTMGLLLFSTAMISFIRSMNILPFQSLGNMQRVSLANITVLLVVWNKSIGQLPAGLRSRYFSISQRLTVSFGKLSSSQCFWKHPAPANLTFRGKSLQKLFFEEHV